MWKSIELLINKFSEFQSRISTFDEILYTYPKIDPFSTPRKAMYEMAEMF